jgi:hypothetical protein
MCRTFGSRPGWPAARSEACRRLEYSRRFLPWRCGGAAAAEGRIGLRQAAVVDHQPALGADGKRPGGQDCPHAPQLFLAHATSEGQRHQSHQNRDYHSGPLCICVNCVICGSRPGFTSRPPRSRISGTASPWRPAGSGGRGPTSEAPADGTPGGRPSRPTAAYPGMSERPRGTNRNK